MRRAPSAIAAPADLLAREPEAALAPLEVRDRLHEVLLAELRPHRLRRVELGVGYLPEEEVRDPRLGARADQEVRVRQLRVVEVGGEGLLVEALGVDLAALGVAQEAARRVDDLG